MRIVAIVQTFNEERFVAGCIEHLVQHGLLVYLIDNSSTDHTVAIARCYLGAGLVGIEILQRHGMFSLTEQLHRKEELGLTLDADWFLHVDADEMRLPPRSHETLADALRAIDADGYNAVNFLEFTFIPTRETPDHDHPAYQSTMRSYYLYSPVPYYRVNAWKKQPCRVELAWSAGHRVRFPGLRVHPQSFPMRHYQFLSLRHAFRKYGLKRFDPVEVSRGWHRWRAQFTRDVVDLPSQLDLCLYTCHSELDDSRPQAQHYLSMALARQDKQAYESIGESARNHRPPHQIDTDKSIPSALWIAEAYPAPR